VTPLEWIALISAVAITGNLIQYRLAIREVRRAWRRGYHQCRRDANLPVHPYPVPPSPVYTAEVIPKPEATDEDYWTQPSEWDEQSVTEAIAVPTPPALEAAPGPGPVTVEFARIMDHTAEQFQSIRDRFALRMDRGGPAE
jgi:hypothetical protein